MKKPNLSLLSTNQIHRERYVADRRNNSHVRGMLRAIDKYLNHEVNELAKRLGLEPPYGSRVLVFNTRADDLALGGTYCAIVKDVTLYIKFPQMRWCDSDAEVTFDTIDAALAYFIMNQSS